MPQDLAKGKGEAPATLLRVKQFAERPVLDFGKVELGAVKTLMLELENATSSVQELRAHKVPHTDGFRLGADVSLPPAVSLSWCAHLQPHSSTLLPISWAPPRAGAVAASLGLQLDGKHLLLVRLVGSGAQAQARPTKPRAAGSSTGTSRPVSAQEVLREAVSQPQATPHAQAAPPQFKVPASRPASGSRAPPGPRAQAPPSTLRLKRAPPTSEQQQPAGDSRPPITPRGRIIKPQQPSEAVCPSPATPAAPGPIRTSVPVNSRGTGAGRVPATPRSRPGVAGSVAGSSSKGSPGASVTTPMSSTSKKTRKTFSFFHTELWMQKQDKAFSSWLNHLLVPSTQGGPCSSVEDDQAASALNDRRLAARMQGALVACYRRDEQLRDTMIRVEARVDQGQLRLKDEALALSDVAVRDGVVAVLLSYHPFWLRLGLEVVTQRAVGPKMASGGRGSWPLQSLSAPEEELRCFVLDHFLGDQDLARESEAARGAAHYDTAEYWRDLGELIVKRFLLLALLLDKVASAAAAARAPTPLLFRVDSTIKSSGEAVHEFLHGRLVGEGNLLRHLELLGYRLAYRQSPLAEYPYAVTNLAVDLRDGLRLVRLAELLAGAPSLSERARFPSDRRPLALHNVGLALAALRAAGVPLDAVPTARGLAAVRAEDIVDGDRDRTLALLWAAARALQLPRLLRAAMLRAEVARVLACGRRRGGGGKGRRAVPLAVYMNDDLACLLMEWVQAVCMQYDVEVHNFTTCFGDGRVLCLLVAYYLPNALDVPSIYCPDETAPTGDDALVTEPEPPIPGETLRPGGWCAMFDAGGCIRDEAAERHRAGVAANFLAVHRAARSLGAVPEMLSSGDWSEHGPDERAVMLYTGFLCGRLLDCSSEDRAAHVIQCAWREARSRRAGAARAHLQAWVSAAAVITRAARAWLFRRAVGRMLAETREARGAVVALQAAWRGHAERLRAAERERAAVTIQRCWRTALKGGRRVRAATAIQAGWRGHVVRKQHGWMRRFLGRCLVARQQLVLAREEARLVRCAAAMQALRRASVARREYQRTREAAVCSQSLARSRLAALELAARREAELQRRREAAATRIQSAWRGQSQRARFAGEQMAVVVLQSMLRAAHARRRLAAWRAAAVCIQSAYRGHAVRHALRASAAFATFLQACYRGGRQRAAFLRLRAAAVAIQAARRGAVQQRRFKAWKTAAVVLQAHWRMCTARRELATAKAAATSIQAAWRGRVARGELLRAQQAAVTLQAAWRMAAAAKAYTLHQQAALVLQCAWRCRSAALLLAHHKAAARVQAHWRGHVVRQVVRAQHKAACRVQAEWRQHVARCHYQQQQQSAIALQTALRGVQARAWLGQQRAAAAVLQRSWRCLEARRLLQRHCAAAVIQAHSRGWSARRRLSLLAAAVTRIQAGWRGWSAREECRLQREALILLQAAVRGWLARKELSDSTVAATVLQAALRGHRARSELRRQAAAATRLQAAWRGHAALSAFRRRRAAAVAVQAAARMFPVRAAFLRQRGAAVALQAAARGLQARELAGRMRAAREIQRRWRGHATRALIERRREAALCLQCMTRGLAARRSAQAMRDYLRSATEFQRMLMELHHRTMAATLVQAAWRARYVRRAFAPAWEAHQRAKAERQAAGVIQQAWRVFLFRAALKRRLAARAAIARHLPALRARLKFLSTRSAALAVQRAWRDQQRRRAAAAVALQSAVRGWLARRKARRVVQAAARVQAAWRGHCVRRKAGRNGREARRRLEAAAAAAVAAPHKRIGVRAREALKVLLASKQCTQVITAVTAIEFSTRYSKECCALIAESGGVDALLTFMRSCNRSKPHAEMLRLALSVLHNVARWRDLAGAVVGAPEFVAVLSERLQMFRDMEDIFLSVVSLLARVAATEEGALAVARAAGPSFLRQWEGVSAIVARKMDMERKYIARLEGQKGSDASAREATRKMVSAAKQLEALQQVLRRVTEAGERHGVQIVHQPPPAHAGASGGGGAGAGGAGAGTGDGSVELPPMEAVAHPEAAAAAAWQPKNTIVRGVFRNMSSAGGGGGAGAAAAAAAEPHQQQAQQQRRKAV